MSNSALAYRSGYGNVRRARQLRETSLKRVRVARPWAEISVTDALTQTSTPPPSHIRRWQWIALAAAVLALHGSLVWYVNRNIQRAAPPRQAELNIEIVRPPKPPEPPKPEPPRPPPKVQPKPARVLPQIQQSEPVPAQVGESSEPPVAVAPVAAEPAPPPPPPPPEPVSEPMGRAGYLNNPPPDYPPQAVRQGWQGTVILRVHVLPSGSADTIEVKQSSGKRVLDEEAIRTVKRWSFAPARRGATPIDGWATVPIEFILDQ